MNKLRQQRSLSCVIPGQAYIQKRLAPAAALGIVCIIICCVGESIQLKYQRTRVKRSPLSAGFFTWCCCGCFAKVCPDIALPSLQHPLADDLGEHEPATLALLVAIGVETEVVVIVEQVISEQTPSRAADSSDY